MTEEKAGCPRKARKTRKKANKIVFSVRETPIGSDLQRGNFHENFRVFRAFRGQKTTPTK